MRIVVDMQGTQNGSRFRGIGRYTTSFVKNLILEARDHEVILALNGAFQDTIEPIREEFSSLLSRDRIAVWQPLSPVSFLDPANDARRQFSEGVREAFLASLKPDVVLISSMVEGAGDDVVTSIGTFVPDIPTAAILYDFIPLIYKDEYLADKRVMQWYMAKFEHLRSAKLLLAISESSRQEGIKYLAFDPADVVNILTAIDPAFASAAGTNRAELSRKFKLIRPYVMYSGASDPRKNLFRLIRAFARLPMDSRKEHQLLLAGGMPQDHVAALRLESVNAGLAEDEVVFTGYISDDEMVGLYRGAKGFVFPSYHEGFGLPVLEAMSLGVPAIGANTSSVPEVIGNPEALFDPWSEDSIATLLGKLISDEKFRAQLTKHAVAQSRSFSWQLTARKALAALVEHFGGSRPSVTKFGAFSTDAQLDALTGLALKTFPSPTEAELLRMSVIIDQTVRRDSARKYLFVDVSELQRTDSKTGIQRVVRNLLVRLLRSPPAGYKVVPVYATPTHAYRVANRFTRAFLGAPDTTEPDHELDARAGDVFLGLDYQDCVIAKHAAYFAGLRRQGVCAYFLVYDILPQMLDGIFSAAVTENQVTWLKTVAMADGLICISRAVADDVKAWLSRFGPKRHGALKVGWFHLGAELELVKVPGQLPKDADETLSRIASKPAFLVVSTIEPRKMQTQVLEAVEELWAGGHDINLVLVGKRGWDVDAFIQKLETHPEANRRLFWLPGITDDYLDRIYGACKCLIAASLGEGFGLSLIEGAMHGLPIIARDIPVFREVAGENARYFNGTDAAALANSMRASLSRELGASKGSRAIVAPWISWDESLGQLVTVFLKDRWYESWSPDATLRISCADPMLNTQIGKRSASGITTTGVAGFLLYGPYIGLRAGNYQVLLHGVIRGVSEGGWHIEVAMNQGKQFLARVSGAREPAATVIGSVNFAVPDGCSDFEVRVMVDIADDLTIQYVELISRVTEGEAASSGNVDTALQEVIA